MTIADHTAPAAARPSGPLLHIRLIADAQLGPEAFDMHVEPARGGARVEIQGGDGRGICHALLDLTVQVRRGATWSAIQPVRGRPHLSFRALKFNLPWCSYRAHPALDLHTDTCRDLVFWQRLLDMLAYNRFNALTLWNLHNWHLMVRPADYPEACDLGDEQLEQWQAFWRALFAMARQRGIETYLINWNIYTAPAMSRRYDVCRYLTDGPLGDGDDDELIRDYNRRCITQVINEYPDLTGLGTSLGERMINLSAQQRQQWVEQVVYRGVLEADRPIRFIQRAPFTIDPAITRESLKRSDLSGPVIVELKFNWSHAHSTPELALTHGGPVDDAYWNPPPERYRIAWMARNEDFFALRWAEPDFIRNHILANTADHVCGYFVGSECFIPAVDYMQKDGGHRTWDYAFERQWLFYRAWGRLLYDPHTGNEHFEHELGVRFGNDAAAPLLDAWTRASRMPLRLASFFGSTWDFTLYCEGFLSTARTGRDSETFDDTSPMITLAELMDRPTLDPAMISIREWTAMRKRGEGAPADRTTPVQLAEMLEADAAAALDRISNIDALRSPRARTLQCELADIEAWCHLSLYFASKLRAGVALAAHLDGLDDGGRDEAVEHLHEALAHWDRLIAITEVWYKPMPLVHIGDRNHLRDRTDRLFHWANLRGRVEDDITLALNVESPDIAAFGDGAGGGT